MSKIGIKKNIFIILFIFLLSLFLYLKFFGEKNKESIEIKTKIDEKTLYNSNIIENVNYSTKDAKGNEYIINAKKGEIDYSNSNILYLTKLSAVIKLNDTNTVTIISDYGKYNTDNFDTIFSKNVIINYLDTEILGEYLDFSLERNSMVISRNVVFTNLENILKADVLEMNIETKDTKIFNYEKEKKVKIKNKK